MRRAACGGGRNGTAERGCECVSEEETGMRGVCGKRQKAKRGRRRIGGVRWVGCTIRRFFCLVFDEVGWGSEHC